MDGLKQWALTLITGGLTAGIAVAVMPRGGATKTLRTVAAVFIILVLISPLVNRETTDDFLPAFNEQIEDDGEESMKEYVVSVCKERIKEEIETAAEETGTNVESAEIEMYIDEEYCINIQTVTVTVSNHEAESIQSVLSEKLGVPVRIIFS